MDSLRMRREERVVPPREPPKERVVTQLDEARKPIFHVLSWEEFGNDICRLRLALTDRALESIKVSELGLKRVFRNPVLHVGEDHVFTSDTIRIVQNERDLFLFVTLKKEDLEQMKNPLCLTLYWDGFGERELDIDPS